MCANTNELRLRADCEHRMLRTHTPKTLSHSYLKPRKMSLETSPPIQLHKIDSEDSSKRKGAFSHSPGSLQSLPTNTARKRHFIEFSLCLSRACLGKIMHLMYKWRKKSDVFSPSRRGLDRTPPSPVGGRHHARHRAVLQKKLLFN